MYRPGQQHLLEGVVGRSESTPAFTTGHLRLNVDIPDVGYVPTNHPFFRTVP
jgi:hypothetical protein